MSISLKLKLMTPSGPYIYHKDSFDGKPKAERVGIWNIEGGKVYASCAGCGAVNYFNNSPDGAVFFDRRKVYHQIRSCIICRECRTHFFVALEDWPEKLSEEHKKAIRLVRRALGTFLKYGYFQNGICSSESIAVHFPEAWQAYVEPISSRGEFVLAMYFGPGNSTRHVYKDQQTAIRMMSEFLRSSVSKKI